MISSSRKLKRLGNAINTLLNWSGQNRPFLSSQYDLVASFFTIDEREKIIMQEAELTDTFDTAQFLENQGVIACKQMNTADHGQRYQSTLVISMSTRPFNLMSVCGEEEE